jgi:predicted alpha/beta hydrolase
MLPLSKSPPDTLVVMSPFAQEHVDRGTDRLGLHVYAPPSRTAPLVILFPAMGTPARYYRTFAEDLRAAGVWPVVADLRGTGSSTPAPSRASRYGYAELAEDVGAVLDQLAERRAGRRTVLLGHSLGGQACALHLARHPESAVDGLAFVAVGLPYWRCYPGSRRFAVLGYSQAVGATAAALGVWPGWTFGGRQSRGVIRDWAYTARRGRFPRLGGMDAEAALATVDVPVLAVSVEHDAYTPPPTTEAICAKLTKAQVTTEFYTSAEAGGPLDHLRWAKSGAALARRIAAFAMSPSGWAAAG